MSELLRMERISRLYRVGEVEVAALSDVSFSLARGEFVAITGPSGSGKSTLMHILGCLDRPSSGEYWFRGEKVSELSRARLAQIRNRSIGFVFQSFSLLPRTSALENVELPLYYSPLPLADQRRAARRALSQVGLSDRASHTPSQLSGGQQQRVAIARALVNEPDLLLADEPTGNLDSQTGAEILALIASLNRERGLTVVVVTHDATVAACARRRISLRDGRVTEDSAPALSEGPSLSA